MGRSGASCHFQMPANRLISRVHVEACYKPALSRLERDRVEIKCVGWNGFKIHCQGRVYDLRKGETFSSDIRDASIMVDVQDPRIKAEGARVMVVWPEKPRLGPLSSDEEDEVSPAKKPRPMLRHSTPPSPSPLHTRRRPISPVSPSPAVQALLPSSPPLLPGQKEHAPVEIYEDPRTEDQENQESGPVTQSTQVLTQVYDFGNDLADSAKPNFSDNDEENDPIVHSFGPFGANLLPQMAAFTTGGSPQAVSSTKTSRSSRTEPLQPNDSPSQLTSASPQFNVRDHIINQLAFSRLSSTPLSTILGHLPQEAKAVSAEEVKDVMRDTKCIGEIMREGKDAAGKALESEYYYVPDVDVDEKRKEAVVNDLMKPSLRSCRKQHKVRLYPTVVAYADKERSNTSGESQRSHEV